MSVALDTNILTRAVQPGHPSHNQTLDALAVLQKQGEDLSIVPQNLYEFAVDHAGRSVEPLNGVSKGGEHPLCDILISGGVKSPPAKWLRLF